MFEESEKNFPLIIFTSYVILNLGLVPDPDWIRIQQQAGSGSRISEYGDILWFCELQHMTNSLSPSAL
jgi:hypothetical protein